MRTSPLGMTMRFVLLFLAIVSLPLAAGAGVPSEPGPYAISTEEISVTLPESRERMPVFLAVPANEQGRPDTSLGPRPVILVLHGFTLTYRTLQAYTENLASYGFIAVSPNRNTVQPYQRQLDSMKELLTWLDRENARPLSPYYRMIDTSRLGMMGHSQGGKVAFHLATEVSGVLAVTALDPVDTTFDPSVVPELMTDFPAASLVVGHDAPPDLCVDKEQDYQQFYASAPSPRFKVTVVGGDHCSLMSWWPYCPCSTGYRNRRTLEMAQWFNTAFFLYFVGEDHSVGHYLFGEEADELAEQQVVALERDLSDLPPTPTPLPTSTPEPQLAHLPLGGVSFTPNGTGGLLRMMAWSSEELLAPPVVGYEGMPTSLWLPLAEAGLFESTWPVSGGLPVGRYLFELRAPSESAERIWPYLVVEE